jgi:hypothetical protein
MGCTDLKCEGSKIAQWKVQNDQSKFFSVEKFQLAESFLREYFADKKR